MGFWLLMASKKFKNTKISLGDGVFVTPFLDNNKKKKKFGLTWDLDY